MSREVAAARLGRVTLAAYAELAKLRIVALVLLTAGIGFLLGGKGVGSLELFGATLTGTALVAAGAGALNHFAEHDADAKMSRTRNRPIPSGRVSPGNALRFGAYLTLAGILLLAWKVNLLTAGLALLTTVLYIFFYTPLKRYSWANTLVGAVPGALPPVGGWAAATASLGLGAWALFVIVFLWQLPHFYAIAWLFRDDYRKAGFQVLPVVEPDGSGTFQQILWFTGLLVLASVLPSFIGLAGPLYALGAVILGLWFLCSGVKLSRSASIRDARQVVRASVSYLALLFTLLLSDQVL